MNSSYLSVVLTFIGNMMMIIKVSLFIFILSTISGSGLAEVICDGDKFRAQCSEGTFLVFDEAVYGRGDARTCSSRVANTRNTRCQLKDTVSQLNKACFGMHACAFPVSTETFGDPCPGTAKYLTVTWHCITASSLTNVCAQSEITSPSGYIISPNYPLNFDPNKQCLLNVEPEFGYETKTTLLDIEMEARPTAGCYDWLTLSDAANPAKQLDYCGNLKFIKQPLEQRFTQLEVKFRVDAMNQFRGFLLKFESVPQSGNLNQVGGHQIKNPPNQQHVQRMAPDAGDMQVAREDEQQVVAKKSGQGSLDSAERKIMELKKALEDLEERKKKKVPTATLR